MRPAILLLLLSILLPSNASSQIGVRKVLTMDLSTPKLIVQTMLPPRLQDMNRDGIPEIVTKDDSFMTEISGTLDVWTFNATAAGLTNPRFLGFFRMTETTGPATHAAFIDAAALHILSLNNKNPELTRYENYTRNNLTVFTMRRLASGREVAIIGNGDEISVIGETTKFRDGGSPLSKTRGALAWELAEKYSGAEGEQLAYDPALFPFEGLTDFDGDGIDDMPFIRRDGSGIPSLLSVYGGDSFDEIWKWQFPPAFYERLLIGFHGVADVDGDGNREMFCGDNLVVFPDGSVQEVRQNFLILHLLDVDADGLLDIIGTDTATDRLLVLGKASATSVAEPPLPLAAALHPAFPNPANSGTVLSFTLRSASNVSLTIHDALGQRVRALFEGVADSGTRQVAWDGADDAGAPLPAGMYSVLLSASGAMQRQNIIITR